MVYFKRFFGDMTGESFTFFNAITGKRTWNITFRATCFPLLEVLFRSHQRLLRFCTERKVTNGRGEKTDPTSG